MHGLFLDFSTAYNTVLHSRLYERLEKVLDKDEVNLIKAIYSRTRIRLGNEAFCPNIGVAQGSTISPALFNIYCEDLYRLLEDKVGICFLDILGYADDIFILCTSPEQLRIVIRTVSEWSEVNNLKLNAKKSGIVEFLHRAGKQKNFLQTGTKFEGIPVVSCYKYLGLWINAKLTTDAHLEQISKKVEIQTLKLWPLLKNVSLDFRINLWTVYVRPLFEMVIGLYEEEGKSNRNKIESLIRKTFRKFTLLKKNVSKKVIVALMDFNFENRVKEVSEITKIKWEARVRHETPIYPANLREEKSVKIYYPKELQVLLNLKTALCMKCRVPCSSKHLSDKHSIHIPTNDEVLKQMFLVSTLMQKESRKNILDRTGEILKPEILKLQNFLMRTENED